MKRVALQLVVGFAGAMLTEWVHVPGGLLAGPMIAIVVIQLAGRDLGKAPRIVSETGEILLGTFIGAALNRLLSLIKSYRAMSHKVVPVRVLASIISRQAGGEMGKASWYAGQAMSGLISLIRADFVSP